MIRKEIKLHVIKSSLSKNQLYFWSTEKCLVFVHKQFWNSSELLEVLIHIVIYFIVKTEELKT